MIIGVTGNVGSGKSTVVGFLREYGWKTIDVDAMAHEIVQHDTEVRNQIQTCFGPACFSEDGKLQRRKLGRIVFSDPEKLQQLNDIVWPELVRILQKQIRRLREHPEPADVAVDMAVLFESRCQFMFDCVLLVVAPKVDRTQRLKQMRHWTAKEIRHRMQSQMDDSEKIEKAHYIIHNDGSIAELKEKIRVFLHWHHQQCQKHRKE